MLAKSIAVPMFLPDLDLDVSVDQSAMGFVMNESEFFENGETLFQPREWYNDYEFHDHYEGEKGDLLVHFPGLEDDRWQLMEDWLNEVEREPAKNDIPLEDTRYPAEVKRFWNLVREAHEVIRQADQYMKEDAKNVQYVAAGADSLERVMYGTELETKPGTELLEVYKENIDYLKKYMDAKHG